MADKTDYARQQEEKHARKIILPNDIPWESGSNRFASQKGMSSFGSSRDAISKIKSTKVLSESSDGVIPWLPNESIHEKLANQSGQTPFGGIREYLIKVQDNDKIMDIKDLVHDSLSEAFLTRWNTPNPEAKNDAIGRKRDATTETVGGPSTTDDDDRKSRAAIPRLMDPRISEVPLHGTGAGIIGYHGMRQATIQVEGIDFDYDDQVKSKKILPWLGGPQIMQTQSKTGGFLKPRDVANKTYYDEKVSNSPYRFV